MNPLVWLTRFNERMARALRPPRRKPVLRVIEGGRKQGNAEPRADATGLRRPAVR
jgi:hypothetical protein